jgi:hypothetical protein
MTWGEFKQWIEAREVKDTDKIVYMDFHYEPKAVYSRGEGDDAEAFFIE